ncbi:unnamed protein product, partial [Polarella glacialis]
VPSVATRSTAKSRECAPPSLVSQIKWPINSGKLHIKWSQPVRIADASKNLRLCHADTRDMRCPISASIGGSQVTPCTGPGGDCAIWSLDVGESDRPTCGGLTVVVDAGAVESVGDGEGDSKLN